MLNLNGKLPWAVLTGMFLQTGAAIWWASGLDVKVTTQGESIKEVKAAVAAITTAKVVVLEAEVTRLQAELLTARMKEKSRE